MIKMISKGHGMLSEARNEVMGGMESELVPTEPSQTYLTIPVVISI